MVLPNGAAAATPTIVVVVTLLYNQALSEVPKAASQAWTSQGKLYPSTWHNTAMHAPLLSDRTLSPYSRKPDTNQAGDVCAYGLGGKVKIGDDIGHRQWWRSSNTRFLRSGGARAPQIDAQPLPKSCPTSRRSAPALAP